ncbi:hypothetical protein Nepgr_028936 [Nepenthes gracilis]|uniref:Uncharacterized protein n=1 Tax=Nepenthes gracilis TaxID=150966 RepID=A0AAD3TBM3_NEPGR|nr:hypothetical protein Nepgr_028936 [Nepenthes gracilis]
MANSASQSSYPNSRRPHREFVRERDSLPSGVIWSKYPNRTSTLGKPYRPRQSTRLTGRCVSSLRSSLISQSTQKAQTSYESNPAVIITTRQRKQLRHENNLAWSSQHTNKEKRYCGNAGYIALFPGGNTGTPPVCQTRVDINPLQLPLLEYILCHGAGTRSKQKIKAVVKEVTPHGQISKTKVYNWVSEVTNTASPSEEKTTPEIFQVQHNFALGGEDFWPQDQETSYGYSKTESGKLGGFKLPNLRLQRSQILTPHSILLTDGAMLMGYPPPYNKHENQSPGNAGFAPYQLPPIQNQPNPSIIQAHGFQGLRPDPMTNVARHSLAYGVRCMSQSLHPAPVINQSQSPGYFPRVKDCPPLLSISQSKQKIMRSKILNLRPYHWGDQCNHISGQNQRPDEEMAAKASTAFSTIALRPSTRRQDEMQIQRPGASNGESSNSPDLLSDDHDIMRSLPTSKLASAVSYRWASAASVCLPAWIEQPKPFGLTTSQWASALPASDKKQQPDPCIPGSRTNPASTAREAGPSRDPTANPCISRLTPFFKIGLGSKPTATRYANPIKQFGHHPHSITNPPRRKDQPLKISILCNPDKSFKIASTIEAPRPSRYGEGKVKTPSICSIAETMPRDGTTSTDVIETARRERNPQPTKLALKAETTAPHLTQLARLKGNEFRLVPRRSSRTNYGLNKAIANIQQQQVERLPDHGPVKKRYSLCNPER